MCPPRPPDNEPEPGLPPGAERFWGQMSQARAGRSGTGEAEPEPEPEHGPDAVPAGECLEWCPICRSHDLLKGVTSPEIRQQFQTIQDEAFQVFRAFASAYSERAPEDPFSRDRGGKSSERDSEPKEPVVTDISID